MNWDKWPPSGKAHRRCREVREIRRRGYGKGILMSNEMRHASSIGLQEFGLVLRQSWE